MRDDRERLADIVEMGDRIADLVVRGRGPFETDTAVQDAMIRRLEGIGEAAANVSAALRKRHPEVPWRLAAAVRNHNVHDGFGLDLQQLWSTAVRDVPNVAEHVSMILGQDEPTGESKPMAPRNRQPMMDGTGIDLLAEPRRAVTMEELREHRDEILAIGERYGVSNIRVFGSVARGEADEQSDLDLLIDVAPGVGLKMVSFALGVQDLMQVFTEIVTVPGLKKRIRDRVLAEAVPL